MALARQFIQTPREQVFDVAAAAARAGAGYETLLGAVFLAGVHDISPDRPGGKLHAVMAIESAFQLAAANPAADGLHFALWAVHDFKEAQQRDVDEGDWVLPPRPTTKFAGADAARSELDKAMRAWDRERADRAIVGLVAQSDHAAVFEALWPYAPRSFTGAGHKMIHAALVERALRRIGWQYAEPVLRTVVRALLANPRGDAGTSAYDSALPRLPKLGPSWLGGKDVPEQSLAIMKALRPAGVETAQQLVVDAFADGLSPATVWDGLRLFAAELFLRRAASRPATRGIALFPVHGVTVCEAVGHAFRTTQVDATKRLCIVQAAGWLTLLRDSFIENVNLSKNGPWLDALGADESIANTGTLLQAPTPAGARGLLEKHPDQAPAFRKALAGLLARKSVANHQLKYAAAMLGEAERAHPQWAARLMAPALPYVPMPADPETEAGKRIEAALKKAGL